MFYRSILHRLSLVNLDAAYNLFSIGRTKAFSMLFLPSVLKHDNSCSKIQKLHTRWRKPDLNDFQIYTLFNVSCNHSFSLLVICPMQFCNPTTQVLDLQSDLQFWDQLSEASTQISLLSKLVSFLLGSYLLASF